ncbi:Somatostatin receptor type 5 [Mactra antiquata]
MVPGLPCPNDTNLEGINSSVNHTDGDRTPCVNNTSGSGASGGGRRGLSIYRKISCGYCDANCVYSAIETLFIIGVLANIIVITRVARDRKLRDPTFVAIATLAFADLLFILLNLGLSFETVILTVTCSKPVILSIPYYVLKSIFWFTANAHVAFLAVLRYLTIAYPIRTNAHLTNCKVIVSSVLVWIVGTVFTMTLTGLSSAGIIFPGKSRLFLLLLWIFVYLLPLIITCVLHAVKIFRVKRSTRESATESTRKSIQRMSRIVIIVIIMAAVLPVPRLIGKCLNLAGPDAYPSDTFKTHFVHIADIIFLINHTINPFIYGFMSVRFRQSVRDMFSWCKKPAQNEDSAGTSDTPLSVRKQNYSLETMQTRNGSVDSIDDIVAR